INRIEEYVPTGVGKRGRNQNITRDIFEEAVHIGPLGLVNKGYGLPADLNKIEEGGCLPGANLDAVSSRAYKRGAVQLGTLGGGNHFIELQVVSQLYDQAAADIFGLSPGALTIMVHTGSRGFGHQICVDYSKILLGAARKYGIQIPDRGLACAPVDSQEGKNYYAAMACAVNYAFANRHLITHEVRRAFTDVLGGAGYNLEVDLVYDIAHNIAKWEEHGGQRLLVHRKGATRALPPGHGGNPAIYRHTGHPVLIPGSMGTASYVVTGMEKAAESFFSANHGAGRVLSRSAATKEISKEQFEHSMSGILYNIRNYRELLDEAPGAYKDINQVVETLAAIGLTRKVARLEPLAVIKGKD
ncbi:MAG: RtcB family protein, partial [Peptococcaceae bacterium]|nr:RtcB family protein [Peptococcaceae bacterium]